MFHIVYIKKNNYKMELFHFDIETCSNYQDYNTFLIQDEVGAKLFEKKFDKMKWNETYETINDALIATVEQSNGTTKIMKNPYVKVAAKSGSAQNSQFKETHAWVAGYFPADNPEIVFVAFVENGGGGGAISAPIAKAFVDKYLELYKGRISEVTESAKSH